MLKLKFEQTRTLKQQARSHWGAVGRVQTPHTSQRRLVGFAQIR